MWLHRRSYPNGGVDRPDGYWRPLDQPEHASVGLLPLDRIVRKIGNLLATIIM